MNTSKFEQYKAQIENKRKQEAEAETALRHGRYIESREHGKKLLRNVLATFGIEIEFSEIDKDGTTHIPYEDYTVNVGFVESLYADGSIKFACHSDGTDDNRFISCELVIGEFKRPFTYHMSDETQFADAIEAFAQALQDAYN